MKSIVRAFGVFQDNGASKEAALGFRCASKTEVKLVRAATFRYRIESISPSAGYPLDADDDYKPVLSV